MFGEAVWLLGSVMGGYQRSQSRSGKHSSHRRWRPSSRSVFRSPRRSHSLSAHRSHRESRLDEIESLNKDQIQQGEDMTAIREMIWELIMAMARAEKRPIETIP